METDIWDMIYEYDGAKLSFEGKKPRSISEILLGTKQYMEGEKQKCQTSQCVEAKTAH